jgi:hypothetical protein
MSPADMLRWALLDKAMLPGAKKLPTRELQHDLEDVMNIRMNEYGTPMSARQVLQWAFSQFDTTGHMDSVFNIVSLVELQWRGDQTKQLKTFMTTWTYVLSNQYDVIDDGTLRDLFYKQIKKSAIFKEEISHYERQRRREPPGDDYSYKYLVNLIKYRLRDVKEQQNQDDRKAGLSGNAAMGGFIGHDAAPAVGALTSAEKKAKQKEKKRAKSLGKVPAAPAEKAAEKAAREAKEVADKKAEQKATANKERKARRAAELAYAAGYAAAPAPPASHEVARDKKDEPCWFHNAHHHGASTSLCKYSASECPKSHRTISKTEFEALTPPGQGKGKGKGKSKSQTPKTTSAKGEGKGGGKRSQSKGKGGKGGDKGKGKGARSDSPSGTEKAPCWYEFKHGQGSCTKEGCASKLKHFTVKGAFEMAQAKWARDQKARQK